MIEKIDRNLRLQMLQLGEKFRNNKPFPHLVLDHFFVPEFIQRLFDEFPPFDKAKATNELGAIGKKAVNESVRGIGPAYRELDDLVQSSDFLLFLSAITRIPDLLYDSDYVGGGTHENLEGQELDSHVDFNYHPARKWHRRLNLLLYLNPEWQPEWGGSIELHTNPWNPDADQILPILPSANRCVIFETSERSWHGFSQIRLPELKRQLSRKSIAFYFYTKERPQEEILAEHGTFYVHRPLPQRLQAGYPLTEEDLQELKDMLQKRDVWVEFLYRREIEFSTELGIKNKEIQRQKEELRRINRSE